MEPFNSITFPRLPPFSISAPAAERTSHPYCALYLAPKLEPKKWYSKDDRIPLKERSIENRPSTLAPGSEQGETNSDDAGRREHEQPREQAGEHIRESSKFLPKSERGFTRPDNYSSRSESSKRKIRKAETKYKQRLETIGKDKTHSDTIADHQTKYVGIRSQFTKEKLWSEIVGSNKAHSKPIADQQKKHTEVQEQCIKEKRRSELTEKENARSKTIIDKQKKHINAGTSPLTCCIGVCQSFRCGHYHHILCPKCMKVWKKGKMGKIGECELYKKKLSEKCRIKDLFRYFPNPCAVCPWPERPDLPSSKQHTRLVPLDILYWTERTHRNWPGWSGNIGNVPCSISEGGNVIFAPWSTVPVHIETCGVEGARVRRRRRRGVRCHYMRIVE
jgi:hypothetical protein